MTITVTDTIIINNSIIETKINCILRPKNTVTKTKILISVIIKMTIIITKEVFAN